MSRRRSRRGRLRRGVGLVLLAGIVWLVYEVLRWPDVAVLAHERPPTTAFIERWQAAERAAGRDGRVAWTWVPYPRISPHLKRAVVVAEDINFFWHDGFDFEALRHAVTQAIEERERPRGASTITQQLAKNLWLSPARTPRRKLREAVLAWQLERHLDKRRILELYLNVAEFGPGLYGAEAASRRYFGKPAADVTAHEAARLAAILPNPAAWHPESTSPAYRRAVASLERRMARAQFLWRLI